MQNYSTPKKMKKIGDLFEKYKLNIKAPQSTVEKAFVKVVYEVSGLKIDKNFVNYNVKTKTLGISAPSIIRSELGFYQTEIINKLNKDLGGSGPDTII